MISLLYQMPKTLFSILRWGIVSVWIGSSPILYKKKMLRILSNKHIHAPVQRPKRWVHNNFNLELAVEQVMMMAQYSDRWSSRSACRKIHQFTSSTFFHPPRLPHLHLPLQKQNLPIMSSSLTPGRASIAGRSLQTR